MTGQPAHRVVEQGLRALGVRPRPSVQERTEPPAPLGFLVGVVAVGVPGLSRVVVQGLAPLRIPLDHRRVLDAELHGQVLDYRSTRPLSSWTGSPYTPLTLFAAERLTSSRQTARRPLNGRRRLRGPEPSPHGTGEAAQPWFSPSVRGVPAGDSSPRGRRWSAGPRRKGTQAGTAADVHPWLRPASTTAPLTRKRGRTGSAPPAHGERTALSAQYAHQTPSQPVQIR